MARFFVLFICCFILLASCNTQGTPPVNRFKTGTFKTVLEDKEATSIAVRNDSLQIEIYNQKKDTFYIFWENNFEYILKKKNPKTLLDSTPFYVKISKVKDSSYHFKANFKGSKFIQKGTAYRIN